MYTETPANFSEIAPFVLCEKEQMLPFLSGTQKLFFYDACAFQKHAQLAHPEPIISYIALNQGIVVLTRSILMELATETGTLCLSFITYIKQLYHGGIKVLILYEEIIFSALDSCFSSTVAVNTCLSWAFSMVQHPSSAIKAIIKKEDTLFSSITSRESSDRMLYQRFFSTIRSQKATGDNLGEEILTICIHLLSNLPSRKAFQYLVLTEDKAAVRLIARASENSYRQFGCYSFSAITTTRLAQQLFEHSLVSTPEQLEELLSSPANSPIKLFGSEEYDLTPQDKVVSPQALLQKITTPGAIHINY